MSSSRIVVPIHLDALYVKERSQVVPPTADFARLPYFDGLHDVHASVPFLGEQAATEPFSEKPCQLDKGIHLHWRFPRALTTGTHLPGGGVKFPSLPDRWLITRAQLIRGHHEVEGQWVIESNFLHPEGANVPASAYPIWAENRSQGRCFRYLGRCLTFQEWKSQTPQAGEYLTEPLTAVGYGEPSFAAFYPNCSSIFGFHDPQYADDIPQGVYYQVVGWNHTPQQDYLQILLAEENKHRRPAESRSVSLGNVLKQQLGWTIPVNPPVDASILCHGSLVFRTQSAPQWTPQLQNPKITFGATITEALSAYLAHEIVPQDAPNKESIKAEIEDQLEAIMLDRTLNNRDLDLAAKFNEARHAKGFDEVYAGILWTVRAQSGETRDEDPEADIAPWPDVADKLYTLNRLQRAYNEAWDEIHATHRQIYSDWCRFMNCVYPQSNSINHLPSSAELRFHLEHSSMPRLKQKLAETGELVSPPGNPEGPLQASASSAEFSLAHLIQQELNALLSSLASHGAQTPGAHYVVQPAVAPRFWRPTEPVILLTGKTVRVDEPAYMEDENASGPLPCELIDGVADLERIVRLNPSRLLSRLTYNPREWREQPWHPFLLQWEVELTPFKALGNLTTADRNYDPKFITHNFTLLKSDVDLSPKSSARLTPNASSERAPFVYQGSSLLTPHVASQFVNQLFSYIERLLQRQLTERPEEEPYPGGILSDGGDEHGSRSRIDRMLGILNERPIQGLGPNTVARLRQVLQNLKKDDFFCLAQRLSGFNDALLMHRQTLQIPIDDPIGFNEIRRFASQVHTAAGDHAHSAPQPLQYFSPIRTGEIQVRRLRLVSTFGRKLDLTVDSLISATPMRPQAGGNAASVFLPPRLVQPARLQFRWLAASAQEREMHAHPDSTPICGWVIVNHLDNNLFVYSGGGQALGYLEVDSSPKVRWRPIPGSANPVLRLDQIDNVRLRRMAAFFLSGSAEYFQVFLTDLQNAQMRIEPEYCGDPLPMGQPLALVRATLSLDVQGPPALHQGWKEFQDNMASNRPDADNFDSVRFPIRLGEQNQLNDGLAVYWLEGNQGEYLNNEYVIPNYQTAATDPQDKKCDFLYQAVSDPPLKVTMLFDPRGVVHAATGILPIKAIQIPPHQYSAALKEFEMAFLTAPVLAGKFTGTPGETIGLPVIDPPGYRWTWLEQRASGWTAPAIDAADLFTPFAGPTEIREGWLKLTRCEVKQKK